MNTQIPCQVSSVEHNYETVSRIQQCQVVDGRDDIFYNVKTAETREEISE